MSDADVLALQIAAEAVEVVARDTFSSVLRAARTVLELPPGRLSYLWCYQLLLG